MRFLDWVSRLSQVERILFHDSNKHQTKLPAWSGWEETGLRAHGLEQVGAILSQCGGDWLACNIGFPLMVSIIDKYLGINLIWGHEFFIVALVLRVILLRMSENLCGNLTASWKFQHSLVKSHASWWILQPCQIPQTGCSTEAPLWGPHYRWSDGR